MKEEIKKAILKYAERNNEYLEEVLFYQGVFWYLSGLLPNATISEVIEVMDEMRKELLQNV